MNAPRLNQAILGDLAEELSAPSYDRRVKPKIVHLGCGAFHRAHQAFYFDKLLRIGEDGWLTRGVSLRSNTALEQLNPQNGLYTLVEHDTAVSRTTIIGSIVDVVHPRSSPEAIVSLLAEPATQLVTLTITEKGYCVDPATGQLQVAAPDVQSDIANIASPVTAPGYIVAGLAARREAGLRALTVLSCDNLSHNGSKVRSAVVGLAAEIDPSLAQWIEKEVAFPSSMVDRITPAVTEAVKAQLADRLGYQDQAMVETEKFHQWVVEDWFSGERPPLELIGVQMTSDVSEWEAVKLRMLNGAHSAMAYLAGLAGFEFVHEAFAAPHITRFIDSLWDELEATLPEVDGFEPKQYRAGLSERFLNPTLEHRLRQIAIDGSQKLPQRLWQPMIERLDKGKASPAIELAIAAWIRWQAGCDFAGHLYELEDAKSELYGPIVREGGEDYEATVRKIIATGIFKEPIRYQDGLIQRLARNLELLSEKHAGAECANLMERTAA